MPDTDKPDFKGYAAWLTREHRVDARLLGEDFYRTSLASIVSQLKSSDAFSLVNANLSELRDKYRAACDADLFYDSPSSVVVFEKKHGPFLLKTYRKNIKDNVHWPNPPDGGWVLPSTWFSQIKDVVRTQLVAKYLDGATFIANEFKKILSPRRCDIEYEARESGYYAIHVVTDFNCRLRDESLNFTDVLVPFEIQITTQLQEVMRSLTHGPYERARESYEPRSLEVWQWNYKSEAFSINYLGHMLRYIEGAIMGIREKK